MRWLYRLLSVMCLFQCFHLQAGEDYSFKGHHFIASYLECDQEALLDEDRLEQIFEEAARASKATVLKVSSYRFSPHGLTMVVLLSESHASIHTYPESGACFVDLFTCGTKCSSSAFDEVLRSYLGPKKVVARLLDRDEEIKESYAVQ